VDPQLIITTERTEDLVVVRVEGETDMVTAPLLDRALTLALADSIDTAESTVKTVVTDLTNVTFFSSSGLSVLLLAHQRSRDTGVPLLVVAPPDTTARRAITALALQQLLTLRDSLVEA
jgi:anti-anti-sigma factor